MQFRNRFALALCASLAFAHNAANGMEIIPPGGAQNGESPGGAAGGDLSGTYPNPVVSGSHISSGVITGITQLQRGGVDVENSNIIQNGGMDIDQPNEGASVTITSGGGQLRSVDRMWAIFAASTSSAGNPTIQQQAVSAGLSKFTKSVLITASGTPSTTVPAALNLNFDIRGIEGSDVYDLAYGTSGAIPVTFSAWFKSSIANAVYGVQLNNSSGTRQFNNQGCAVPTANTWAYCTLTFPGSITGTWLTTPGTQALQVALILASGATPGTAGTWQTTGYALATQTQFTATASATLETTGWKLERGSVATAFVPIPAATLTSQLQRYYRKSFPAGTAPAQSAGVAGATCVQNPIAIGEPSAYVAFNPPMAASPTIVTFNPSAGNANWRDVTAGSDVAVTVDGPSAKSLTGVILQTAGTITTLADVVCIHYTASTAF